MITIISRDPWDNLGLLPLKDGSGFRTLEDYQVSFTWTDDEKDYFNILTVPKGFHTDLASVPRAFRWLIRTWGPHTAAAITHDCMYSYQAGTRALADALFAAILKEDGVGRLKTMAMVTAVRTAGSLAWNSPDPHPQPDPKDRGEKMRLGILYQGHTK